MVVWGSKKKQEKSTIFYLSFLKSYDVGNYVLKASIVHTWTVPQAECNKLKFLSHSRWELCLPFCSLLNIVYSKENWYGSNSIWLQNVNELFFWKLCCLCLMLDRSWNVLCRCLMHWLVFFAGLIYPQRHCGMVVGFCVSYFPIVSQDSITSILNYWE
jgi:hypothetical protein